MSALLLDLGARTLAVGGTFEGDQRSRLLELGHLLVREGRVLPKE